MTNTIAAIDQHLRQARNVAILTHVMPDGDCLGSGLGLAWALRGMNKQATVYNPDPVPPEYTFLPGSDGVVGGPDAAIDPDTDLIVIVDCSDMDRVKHLYNQALFERLTVINIDHHRTNTEYADINFVDASAGSACEIVLDLVQENALPLDESVATCLLCGTITDTRGFRTTSSSPRTFRAATTLSEAGADIGMVMDAVFNHRSAKLLTLWSQALPAAHLEEGLLWTAVTAEMLASVGGDTDAVSGLANFLSTFHDAQVALVLTELAEGVDVSMRSRPEVDVSAVAFALGGGGHRQAAGCQLREPLADAEARVVAEIRKAQAVARA